MTDTAARRWLFADQLGPHFLDSPRQPVLLVEARSVFRRRRFHRQKAHLLLSALRHRAAELGERALLIQADSYREALRELAEPVSVCAPTSHAADAFVRGLDDVTVLPARGFVSTREEFEQWAASRGRQRLLLEDFYRDARRRLDILMDGTEPAGGRWNLDADNRKPPPRHAQRLDIPAPWWPTEDEIDDGSAPTWTSGNGTTTCASSAAPGSAGCGDPQGGDVRRTALSGRPVADLRAVRGRHAGRRPVDGAQPAVGADESRLARPARARPPSRGRYDPRSRVGENACPYTAGYWAFLARDRDRLRGNQRMQRPLAGLAYVADIDDVVDQEARRGSQAP